MTKYIRFSSHNPKNMKPIITFLFVLSTIGLSAQKKAMSLIDFLNVPGVSSPVLSPDGSQFLFVKSETNWKENRQINHVWRGGLDGSSIKLTNGEKGENSPAWSPNGQWISFAAKRGTEEENQIYLISNQGGEGRSITKHKTPVQNIQWADDQTLYFLARDPKSPEEEKKDKLKDDVYAYDENFKQIHLWRIHIGDSAASRITSGDYSINDYVLSRDANQIVVTRGPSPLFDDSDENELWIIDKNGKNELRLTNNKVSESSADLSPDGKTVLFVANANENFDTYYNDKLFTVPASGGKPTLTIKDNPYQIFEARWSKDGNLIYLYCNKGLESQLFTYTSANASLTEVTKGNQAVVGWNYNSSIDQHLLAIADEKNAGDLSLLKGADAKTLTRLTHVYDYLDTDFKLPHQERVTWKGADGVAVEGLLIYPTDYVSGKLYPLVVQTHGGPASADQFGFSRSYTEFHAVLASKGYMILQPNYRGSTGYGDAFLRDMVGSYFKNSHLDVMTGVDYLIAKKLVDPNKMVKMGWSAGGHMTNKLITFTDRFKAASSGAGAANWISMYGQSDVRIYRTPWFGGTPWQKNAPIEKYWNNSPLKDVSKVKTPTLFIVGGSDPRVPPPQSVEMFQALKSLGVPTHLYMAPREPHGWTELRHRLQKMNVELEWFGKYALGEKYVWEKAPEK